jgi:hypothetical protein
VKPRGIGKDGRWTGPFAGGRRPWYEHLEHYTDKLRWPLSIAFAFVATHNHFVFDRGGKVFKQSAPVIMLLAGDTEDEHLCLIGLLNCSTACFWMKQAFQTKGSSGIGRGIFDERWEQFFEHTGTGIGVFPVLESRCKTLEIVMARQMAAGELQTSWFDRHGSTSITEIPGHWPESYRALVQRRLDAIRDDPNIALIERPEYKRRWNREP